MKTILKDSLPSRQARMQLPIVLEQALIIFGGIDVKKKPLILPGQRRRGVLTENTA
jgi:hypothetical protein